MGNWQAQSVDLAGGTPQVICDVNRGFGGAWTIDGQIIFGALGFGLRRVPASGGTPSPLTTLDALRSEGAHHWPQALPNARFLFWVLSDKPENTGIYVASLAKPNERVHLLSTDAKALYVSGDDGRDYLVWQRAGTLVAQEFDTAALQVTGEVRTLADRVAMSGAGLMNAAVSSKLLLYSESSPVSQFTWFDRAGRPLGLVGDSGDGSAVAHHLGLQQSGSATAEVNFGAQPTVGQISLGQADGGGLLDSGIRGFRTRPNPNGPENVVDFGDNFYKWPNTVSDQHLSRSRLAAAVRG